MLVPNRPGSQDSYENSSLGSQFMDFKEHARTFTVILIYSPISWLITTLMIAVKRKKYEKNSDLMYNSMVITFDLMCPFVFISYLTLCPIRRWLLSTLCPFVLFSIRCYIHSTCCPIQCFFCWPFRPNWRFVHQCFLLSAFVLLRRFDGEAQCLWCTRIPNTKIVAA
jgi:hypothetical protein